MALQAGVQKKRTFHSDFEKKDPLSIYARRKKGFHDLHRVLKLTLSKDRKAMTIIRNEVIATLRDENAAIIFSHSIIKFTMVLCWYRGKFIITLGSMTAELLPEAGSTGTESLVWKGGRPPGP